MNAPREVASALHRLADEVGILPGYLDITGSESHQASDETRVALLAALGIDASTEERAEIALAELLEESRREQLAPVSVVEWRGHPPTITLRTCGAIGRWRLDLTTEDGARHVTEGDWPDAESLDVTLPAAPPIGYHTLALTTTQDRREVRAEQSLIVVPSRCVIPSDLFDEDVVFGVTANLYTIRSESNWGVGDFADLSTLIAWTSDVGGDFVGVNPLHALLNRGNDIGPYNPVSRIFRNPIYLAVGAVPEMAGSPALAERLGAPEFQAELASLRESATVRYEQVSAVKGLALDTLHRTFVERTTRDRGARALAYDAFVAAHNPALDLFAKWMVIGETYGYDWRAWPDELQDSSSAAVERFAVDHAERVDYHRWVQFELDRQLMIAADSGRARGMRLGLYTDLAVGSSPSGADSWAYRDLFVQGASIGAPPDPYAPAGQNWGIPPIAPHTLRRDRYRYFIQLIRSGFRHAGVLRIDHVMGLFRLFWIPQGGSGDDGAYVRYPAGDLLGILALESHRNSALVVGEDLGTVPDEVPRALEKWGILSSKVLFFERERDGEFKAAEQYPALALATADTHDMAPINGIWEERDIDLRAELGLLPRDDQVRHAREERARERERLLERLANAGVLPTARPPLSLVELRAAIHAFICRTPARLAGLSLDDLAGETEPVNVPGVPQERHLSWSRKMHRPLASICANAEVRTVLRCDGRARTSSAGHAPV
jgi:4-alpha-glucanotransferase